MRWFYSLDELEEMPTIRQGHFGNLKAEDEHYRVWMARGGKADGYPDENWVSVEHLKPDGCWKTVCEYSAMYLEDLYKAEDLGRIFVKDWLEQELCESAPREDEHSGQLADPCGDSGRGWCL